MNTKKLLLVGAALTSLQGADAFGSTAIAHAEGMGEAGQCHGVNACKGKGDCQGMGHECEGKNTCKGKGWVKMSKEECEKNSKGHWEAMPEKHYGLTKLVRLSIASPSLEIRRGIFSTRLGPRLLQLTLNDLLIDNTPPVR